MTSDEERNSASSNEMLDRIIADYVRAVEAGAPPRRDELLAAHPELAHELRDFFRHRDRMEALLDPLRSAAARVLHVRCPHCHHTIELLDHARVTDLNCPSCGSNFSLVGTAPDGPSALKRIGQFQLVEPVGVGQFGVVWKARDLTLERSVAIKIPRNRELNASEAEVFLRDARVAAQLRHPNVVGVHEVGKYEDTIYIVSDFIQGASLKEWAAAQLPTVREAVLICATVADALHYAHESGVVHRDLKPGNIMIDLEGEPRIVDFGLAKRETGEITMTVEGQILGTPAYMPPEQAQGDAHQVDRTADIYSLGVILFELITGELPFRGDKQMLLVQILKDEPPSPRKLNTRVPRDLETVCLKCMEKDPLKRYATAELLADDLRRFIGGQPVRARAVSRLARGWRWCRRSPIVAGLAATVAVLLIAIAVVMFAAYWETQNALVLARKRAETIERNLYYSEMNRAGAAAMNPDGLALVGALLEDWQPAKTQVDRRGWEWRYLNSLLHQDLVTLSGHEGGAFSVAWSPDGSLLATGSGKGVVTIWAGDGRAVHTFRDHTAQINSVVWNREGTLLASAGYDAAARIWDVKRGELLSTLRHEGPVEVAQWSPDSRRLGVVNSNPPTAKSRSTVTIWGTSTWATELEFGAGQTQITDLCWNPDGTQIALGSVSEASTGSVRICDAVTGETIRDIDVKGRRVAWNRDGARLAAADVNRLTVWDVATQMPVARFESHMVGSLAWSPDGGLLAHTSGQKTVNVSDVAAEQERTTFRGHLGAVVSVCWHPSGRRIATAGMDGAVKVWNTSARSGVSAGSRAISWNPDGSRYASRGRHSVLICSPGSTQPIEQLPVPDDELFSVAWSPDGKSIASGGLLGEVRVWDATTGKVRWSQKTLVPDRRFGAPLPAVLAWSPDSRKLAFPQAGHSIGIVDAQTAEKIRHLQGHTEPLRTLAWSPDGKRLASGGYDGVLHVWNAVTGEVEKQRNTTVDINSVCWSPDGARIAAACSDNNVNVYGMDALPGPPLMQLRGHTTYVHAVSWSADGERIASADESGSIRIWDAHIGAQTLALSYPGGVPMVAWSPDGTSLGCVGFGGAASARIWNAKVDRSAGVYW